jgi:uncharacterized protein with HEPN domain
MSYHDDKVYLRHIYDAAAQIRKYIQGVTEEEFAQTSLLQDGVIRQLEIVGEATKQLSKWVTAKEDVPLLQAQIKVILNDFGINV